MSRKFEVFLDEVLKNHESCSEEDIFVVSLIGKDSADWKKCDIFNETLEASVFCGSFGDDPEIFIEAYFSEEELVLFLILHGMHCDDFQLNLFTSPKYGNKSFFERLAEAEYEESNLLHVVLILSHLVFFVEQGRYFDSYWLKTLAKVNQLRLNLKMDLKDELKQNEAIGREWANHVRLAIPRFCFLFPDKMVRYDLHASKKKEITEKLEVCWQNQIKDVLKGAKLVDVSLSNCVGHLPESDKLHYAFVGKSQREEPRDIVASLVMKMTETRANYGIDQENDVDCAYFIRNHIKEIYDFDYEKEYFYYFPTLKEFVIGAKIVLKNCIRSSQLSAELSELVPELDIVQLIESSNHDRLIQAYKKVLLVKRYLTQQEHLSEVNKLVEYLKSNVTSDNVQQMIDNVVQTCTALWEEGHQRCEAVSLTGHACKRPVHDGFAISHNSDYKCTSSCNCGRKQATRNDPFNLKEANFDFYKGIFSCCSNESFYLKLPLFVPEDGVLATDEKVYQRSVDGIMSPSRKSKQESSSMDVTDLSQPDIVTDGDETEEEEDCFDRYLDEDKLKEMFFDDDGAVPSRTIESPSKSEKLEIDESDEEEETGGDYLENYDAQITGLNVSKRSTITYEKLLKDYKGKFLEYMLHSKAPAGMLPGFPSWAVFCIGKSNRYSHASGLKSPNFKRGSDHLLPLDHTITVRSEDWDSDMRLIQKSGYKFSRNKNTLDTEGTHREKLRFFIGFDYECQRGHRFIIERPGKCLNMDKNSGAQTYREEAANLLRSDIPLWMPCTCKRHPYISAQLMRLHIVLPKGPIAAKLDLKIEVTNPLDGYFYPSPDPIELSHNRYYVIRFPFVYEGPNGPLHAPKTANTSGRLMKNWMTVEHIHNFVEDCSV